MDAARSAAAGDAAKAPAVSVVLSTYNRSNVLSYAIESVVRQTRSDWELIVVGDGCTDDTAEVVARFEDPRIRFVDLRPRVGDQSGPTNAAIALARGRFIALLNHDDFWFPDHLARALETLDETGADLTFTLQLEADPDGRWRVNATYPDGGFDPIVHPNASTWVFRRELAERLGPLRHRNHVYTYPTRDWLWRAYKSGAEFAASPAVTVLVVSATTRRNVYAERQWREHEESVAGDVRRFALPRAEDHRGLAPPQAHASQDPGIRRAAARARAARHRAPRASDRNRSGNRLLLL